MKRPLLFLMIALGIGGYLHYVRGWDIARFKKETVGRFAKQEAPPAPIGQRGTGTHWETVSPMKIPRGEFGAALIGERIYVVGGLDGYAKTLSSVEAYDIPTDTWVDVAPLPHAVHHPAVATDGSKLYVVGGLTGIAFRPLDTFQVYDPATNSWTESGRLNDFTGAGATAFVDGRLMYVGGVTTSGVAKSLGWYDPNTGVWNGLKEMANAREHLAAVGLGRKLYAVGGRRGSLEKNTGAIEVYDAYAQNWTSLSEMPTARGGISAALNNNAIYVFGGEGKDGTFGQVEIFDLKKEAWTKLEQELPHPRHGLAAVSYKNRIYVLGGGRRPGFAVSDLNEVLVFGDQETPVKKK